MKKKSITFVVSAMAAATLLSAPVFAAKLPLSNTDLDAVSGAANNLYVGSSADSTVNGSNANGNIQVAYFQWDDNHSHDQSINKGGNIQNDDQSEVQMNATVEANALAWGAIAQSITTNTRSPIGGEQKTETWAILFIGGF